MQIKDFLKKYIAFVLCLAFLCAGLIFQVTCAKMGEGILEQNIAKSYGQDKKYTHISLFTSEISGFTFKDIPQVRGEIKKAIKDGTTAFDTNGRDFLDAYTSIGKLNFISQKASGAIQVYAVAGDFFVFHPMTLVSGSYFADENDENEDGIVLNELAAWQLFGAIDVTGMQVEVADISMPVRGVVKDIDTKFSNAAGENIPRVYLSYNKYLEASSADLENAFGGSNIYCYEALIINPVKDFALNTVKNTVELEDDTYEYVINNERFSFVNRLYLIKNFFNRVMNKTGVIYPYWENYARAKEQVIMLITILELLGFIASFVFLVIGLARLKPEYLRLKTFLNNKKEDLSEFIKAKMRKRMEEK